MALPPRLWPAALSTMPSSLRARSSSSPSPAPLAPAAAHRPAAALYAELRQNLVRPRQPPCSPSPSRRHHGHGRPCPDLARQPLTAARTLKPPSRRPHRLAGLPSLNPFSSKPAGVGKEGGRAGEWPSGASAGAGVTEKLNSALGNEGRRRRRG